jgi:hypothetical protein
MQEINIFFLTKWVKTFMCVVNKTQSVFYMKHKRGVALLVVFGLIVFATLVARTNKLEGSGLAFPHSGKKVFVLMVLSHARLYGQCGTQIQTLLDVFASMLGSSRAIVEPMFVIQPRNNTAYELDPNSHETHFLGTASVPWSSWLDVKHLEETSGLIVLPAVGENTVDIMLSTEGCNGANGEEIEFQYGKLKVLKCNQVSKNLNIEVWRKMLKDAPERTVGILVKPDEMFGSHMWRDDANLRPLWMRMISAFKINSEVANIAARFAPPHPYKCCHWRRGDRGHAEMREYGKQYWGLSAPDKIAKLIDGKFFVMTNSGNESEKSYLEKHGAEFLPSDIFTDWRQELQRMGVEMKICIDSDVFIAAGADFWGSSTPSRLIIDWRGNKLTQFLT